MTMETHDTVQITRCITQHLLAEGRVTPRGIEIQFYVVSEEGCWLIGQGISAACNSPRSNIDRRTCA